MSRGNIGLVLDASAMAVYARNDSTGVGETLTEVASTGRYVALPVASLVETMNATDLDGLVLLELLTRLPHSRVLPVPGRDWRNLGHLVRKLGGFERAVALATAVRGDAMLMTAEPAAYQPAYDDDDPMDHILAIEDDF